jgi:hypothetical protein
MGLPLDCDASKERRSLVGNTGNTIEAGVEDMLVVRLAAHLDGTLFVRRGHPPTTNGDARPPREGVSDVRLVAA